VILLETRKSRRSAEGREYAFTVAAKTRGAPPGQKRELAYPTKLHWNQHSEAKGRAT
jgi:hypothetical protein